MTAFLHARNINKYPMKSWGYKYFITLNGITQVSKVMQSWYGKGGKLIYQALTFTSTAILPTYACHSVLSKFNRVVEGKFSVLFNGNRASPRSSHLAYLKAYCFQVEPWKKYLKIVYIGLFFFPYSFAELHVLFL